MKPKAAPVPSDKKETLVTLIPHQGPQVNVMTEYYHDSKLKRTKVCACASVLIALIMVAGVLGSIVLWKIRFPHQNDNIHKYKSNLHKYPPHDHWGGDGHNNRQDTGVPVVTPKSKTRQDDLEDKTDEPDVLRVTSEVPQNGNGDGIISIDDGEVSTVRPRSTLETLTMSRERTVTDRMTTTAKPPRRKPTESISDSFGSFEKSFNYYWKSWDSSGSVSSSLDEYEYIVPGSASLDEGGKPDKLIPWTPDYESDSMSTPGETPPEGSGFGYHHNRFGSGDEEEGSGFGDMETSGDSDGESGDYDSIDYLPLPEAIFDTQQFEMLENDYSSSVTEISNVLKDPKQEYEFWKYIYDQSEVLVDYIEGARQKLLRQELSPDVVDPHLPSVQIVRTPGPEDNFRGKCYNLVCTMKSSAADDDDMRWALTGYAREGVRLVHASGNKGEVQITLRRQPISARSTLHFNSYLLMQFSDVCFISQVQSSIASLPDQRADFPIVETFQSTAQVYTASSSEFCKGLPVYWARKVTPINYMHNFGDVSRGDNATQETPLRKDIKMPCCHCEEEPCICSCDVL